jgi:hypothetical protein
MKMTNATEQITKIVPIELKGEETIEWSRTINVVVPFDASKEELEELESGLFDDIDGSLPDWDADSSGIYNVDHWVVEQYEDVEPSLTLTRNADGVLDVSV